MSKWNKDLIASWCHAWFIIGGISCLSKCAKIVTNGIGEMDVLFGNCSDAFNAIQLAKWCQIMMFIEENISFHSAVIGTI